MTDSEAAAEHLKLIRGMMERATVYRAISAPAAIFGGILATLTGGYFFVRAGSGARPVDGREFYLVWIGVLVVVGVFNTALLWRKSKAAGEPLWSPGMKLACSALAPTLLAGGILSYLFVRDWDEFELCVLAWVLCYGAALLAMGGVAPRSIRRLGWMFVVAGLLLFVAWRGFGPAFAPQLGIDDLQAASCMMMATFGLLHLVHGVGVVVRKGGDGEPA